MLKGYKFRMYLNPNQEQLINKTFGCSRFIYNHFLEQKKTLYNEYGINKPRYWNNVFRRICKLSKVTKKMNNKKLEIIGGSDCR